MAAKKQTSNNGQPPEKEEPVNFLREIDNKDHIWLFHLIGSQNVVGNVIDYLWTEAGVPIVLLVKQKDGKNANIPWGSIQTIFIEKE